MPFIYNIYIYIYIYICIIIIKKCRELVRVSTRYSGDSKSGRTGMVITLAPFWGSLPTPVLLYSPVRTFPPRSNLRGRDMTVPKPLPQRAAVMSLCVRSRIRTGRTNLELPAIEQTSGLTACAINPVGAWS